MNNTTKTTIMAVIFISAIIIFYGAVIVLFMSDPPQPTQYEQYQSFLKEKHICPDCGWEGPVGKMEYIGGEGIPETFYCPECGSLIAMFYT